jgi:hypothetical protein
MSLHLITTLFIDGLRKFVGTHLGMIFVPPSHLHEFDSIFGYVVVIIQAHDYFVLDIFFLWFITKHKGRIFDFDEMLGWIHWFYDYT